MQAPGRRFIDRHYLNLATAINEGQFVPIDLADPGKFGISLESIIASKFRYIEQVSSLLFLVKYVFLCSRKWIGYSCPRNCPSHWVICCGSLLLHVTRYITRQ